MKLWQDHYVGKTNVIYERYKFNNRVQKEHSNVEQYVTALSSLASTCEFGILKDMIREKIVCGIRSDSIRTKLIQEVKLTLARCISLARSADIICRAKCHHKQSQKLGKPAQNAKSKLQLQVLCLKLEQRK